MKKYKVNIYDTNIKEVKVDSETDKFVVINGRKEGKMSRNDNYFSTLSWACRFKYNLLKQSIQKQQEKLEMEEENLSRFLNVYGHLI